MVGFHRGLTACKDLLRVCVKDAFIALTAHRSPAHHLFNTASIQSCKDGLKLPGSWATPSFCNMNFFIVCRFSQLPDAMTRPLTALSGLNRAHETLCCRFLVAVGTTCDNTSCCGASVAHNVSTLLGIQDLHPTSRLGIYLPLTDLVPRHQNRPISQAPWMGATTHEL